MEFLGAGDFVASWSIMALRDTLRRNGSWELAKGRFAFVQLVAVLLSWGFPIVSPKPVARRLVVLHTHALCKEYKGRRDHRLRVY